MLLPWKVNTAPASPFCQTDESLGEQKLKAAPSRRGSSSLPSYSHRRAASKKSHSRGARSVQNAGSSCGDEPHVQVDHKETANTETITAVDRSSIGEGMGGQFADSLAPTEYAKSLGDEDL